MRASPFKTICKKCRKRRDVRFGFCFECASKPKRKKK